MSKAILINDSLTTYLCNICSEKIEKNNIIGLKCDFKKHIFCYQCIYDWYKEINYNSLYTKQMCPICRKKGGLLPQLNDVKFIKNIHYNNDEDEYVQNCGTLIKNKNTTCYVIGKPENKYKCCRHTTKLKKEKNDNIDKKAEVI